MALLAAGVRRGLKLISATGAGARADPTRIRISDLSESSNDPLSRSVSVLRLIQDVSQSCFDHVRIFLECLVWMNSFIFC